MPGPLPTSPDDGLGYESEVQSARGVGLYIPPRESDCTGEHPSWWDVQWNTGDECVDGPDQPEIMPTRRHWTIY